ncbi:hypothetical protein [Brucella intermedia]|uniref:aldose epimerase family protein n=2 Tax=Brucella intermedia TaxID=94625 RepID=UPI00124D67A6|nr:hypothetical protein [Brucella intermedia]KAB2693743.1 hypothetical protein F9K72_14440 [Brucella intermedia]
MHLTGTSWIEIASSGLKARLSPEMGGRLLQLLSSDGTNILVPGVPHKFHVTEWPKAGAYPLVPYHNRISDARIAIGEQSVKLVAHPMAEPHTLHGPGHTRPWSLVSHATTHLVMKLDYEADSHWPWDFQAIQTYELVGNELRLAISLSNLSNMPMPAGIGWHPYFNSAEPVSTDAQFTWPHAEDYLPIDEKGQVLDEDSESAQPTRYLGGWKKARIRLAGGKDVFVSASSEFGFLVLHRGHTSHICVEPVSHVPNAWNLKADPVSVGACVLQPEEVLRGTISVKVPA